MQMIKTVGELREMLEDFDDETPVKMATQPSYPWSYAIGEPVEIDGVVYIPEAGGQDSCPRDVFGGW